MNPPLTERNIIELRDHMSGLYTMTRELDEAIGRMARMGICNGTEYWRDEDGKPQRLYANHAVGVKCPLHGSHSNGRRLRKYVPMREEQSTRDAIKRWEQHQDLNRQRARLHGTIASLEQTISTLAREAAWPLVHTDAKR